METNRHYVITFLFMLFFNSSLRTGYVRWPLQQTVITQLFVRLCFLRYSLSYPPTQKSGQDLNHLFFFPLLQWCSIPCPQEGQLLPHFRLFRISLQWEFSFSFIFITRSSLGSSSHCPTFCIPSNTSHFHPDPGNLPPIPDITSILVAKIGCRPPVAHCLCQAPLCFNPCRHCCLGKTMLQASHQALRSFLVFNSATVPN